MTPENFLEEISKDHAELSTVVRTLREALDAREYGQAKRLLLALQHVEARHYATESALMQVVDYPHAEQHRSEHAALLDTLDRINQTLALENPGSISPKIVAHLEAAIGHMVDADEKLNRFVLERLLKR